MATLNITKRNFGGGQLKLLIATGALAATMGFWSVFANRDRLANLQNSAASPVAAQQAALDLGAIPTLVPFSINGVQPVAQPQSAQTLRQVSAPQQSTANTSGPVVIRGNRSNSAPVTNGRTS